MAYAPIALTMPQYEDYANWYLKAYTQGTTTPLSMATDSGGGTTLAKSEIDANGFPTTDGSARFIPYINGAYDLWMFPTSAEADANDTTNAIQLADNINADPSSSFNVTTARLYSTVSAMLSDYANINDGDSIIVSGFNTAGDGGGGDFVKDESVDRATHNGITVLSPTVSFPSDWANSTQITAWFTADTGNGCLVRVYSGAADLRWSGAKVDGVTNDSPMWQQAVDTLDEIYVPAGTTLLQTQVRISKPVIINGAGDGADLSTANRITGVTLVSCTAAAGAFFLKSQTLGNFLYGVQIKNMAIDGNNIGLIGIAGATISQCEFDNLHISRFTTDQLLIDDTNQNISVYNHIGRIVTNNGANAACADANGVRLRSTGYDGVVQTVIENLSTTITNGSGLKIGGADNNIILKHFSFRQAAGTGYALYFYADTFLASRNNTVVFLGGGQVRAANNSYGNRIMHTTSEATEITIDSGGQLHYVTHDYVSADLHSTHVFKMSDRLYMSANELHVDGTAIKSLHAAMWGAVIFPNAATGGAYFNLPQNYDWHDGEVTGIELVFSTDTANASANARMRVRGSSLATGEATATPVLDQSFTVAVNDTANRINKATLTFTTALTYTKNDTVLFRLDRFGGDALDTMLGDFELLGLNIIYQSTGPNFSGSGPYDVGPVDV